MESNNQSMPNSTITITTNPFVKMNMYGRAFEAQSKGILLVAYRRRYMKLKKMNGRVSVVYDSSTSPMIHFLRLESKLLQCPFKHKDYIAENILDLNLDASMVQRIVSFAQFLAANNNGYLIVVKLEFIQLEAMCSICLDEFSKSPGCKFVATKCSHVYHEACILPWLRRNNTCPNCRGNLNKGSFGSFVSGHKFKL